MGVTERGSGPWQGPKYIYIIYAYNYITDIFFKTLEELPLRKERRVCALVGTEWFNVRR